ncbi:hypothetical protein EIK77_003422 [Talaromyces pinophilus]|nr:hypothetical protein EIK77_003422 [Talaromyces pinophilus]
MKKIASAILQFNPDAMDIAAALDAERQNGTVRGPLHGIPFVVKDNIASKDKMETTAGSWALVGSVVPRDAHVVYRLREAGAVLLGKAALSEWADMRSNDYSEGYSGRGGQCRNPYNFTVNPGGSSTGSGITVSSNQVSFALGTETDGSGEPIPLDLSIVAKANMLRDATYVLDAIYGIDQRDNYTLAQKGKTPNGGYSQFLTDKLALKGAVFGLPWLSFWQYNDPAQNAQLMELLDLIRSAGATIINGTELPYYKDIVDPQGWNWDYGSQRGYPNESEYTYVKVDFYNNIKSYLSDLENTNIRSLEDIVKYNDDNAGSEGGIPGVNPAFASGQDGFLASLATKGVMNETYWQALTYCQRTSREDGIDAALNYNGHNLTALLVPPDFGPTYEIAAQAGYPVITLPAGINKVSKMPYGLALIGTAFSEATLIKYASAIEDLQLSSDTPWKRSLPTWSGYLERNIPVINA